jgi:hypothetical protein
MREGLVVRPMKIPDAGGIYRTSSEALTATADEREKLGRRGALKIERRKERYQLDTKDKLNSSEAAAIR